MAAFGVSQPPPTQETFGKARYPGAELRLTPPVGQNCTAFERDEGALGPEGEFDDADTPVRQRPGNGNSLLRVINGHYGDDG